MKDFKKEMEKKISDLFSNFQKVHLSENTNSIRTHLANNTISIRSESCLTASEKKLIKQKQYWELLKQVKEQKFEKVNPLLKKELEELTCCTIINIKSILGVDGTRLEFFILKENLEKKLLKAEEISHGKKRFGIF